MPIAPLKVVFLWTVDNANRRGTLDHCQKTMGDTLGDWNDVTFNAYQPYDVAFYAYQPVMRRFMLISCGKKLKPIFLQMTSFFRCGMSGLLLLPKHPMSSLFISLVSPSVCLFVCLSVRPPIHLPGKQKNVDFTPAAHGLEELFSTVLERFLQPIHALRVQCKN